MASTWLSGLFGKAKALKINGAYWTNSGMLCIWDPAAFRDVRDYETWEPELLDDADILRHIKAAEFVPINIGSDGSFQCEVRVGSESSPATMAETEKKLVVVASEPYRFRTHGELCISGIEHVDGTPPKEAGKLSLPSGEYVVVVHMIDWESVPGSRLPDGRPSPTALPDFLILVNPSAGQAAGFREKVETFDRPE